MDDYSKMVKVLRPTAAVISDEKLEVLRSIRLTDAANSIEELMAQLADKDYLIQQQTEEIERLRRDVKKQQEKMFELAKKLPKRGKWINGREIGKEWIYDHWVAYYEDWHCSNCKVVFEQEEKPKYNYCPNCGAKMGVQE